MARGYFCGGGSGGVDCDDATALEADILEGKTAGISGKDEIVSGKMPERGDWSSTELAAGESITIPGGHHSGKGMVTTKSLEKQTPGNLDANKMLLGTYGWSKGKRVDGKIYSQEGIILNPGTTAKTGMVLGKYMLGNITVPAISIPADYIKKGQRITFPDGSSVVGTFEGWVPVATDLYYNGANANGFTIYGTYARLENNRIYFIETSSASPINSTYKDPNNDYGAFLRFGKTVDVRSYTKMIFEGFFYGSTSAGKSNFAIFDSSGTIRYKESDESGNIVPQKQIVIDITQSSYINAGSYMKFGGRDGGYITRIRLE